MKVKTTAITLAWLALAGAGAAVGSAEPAWHRAPGGLLPLQDRVGIPRLAAAVEETLRQRLTGRYTLVEPAALRDAQRRLRLRDPSQATPEALARLGELSGAAWLFSATLHRASEDRVSRSTRAYTDAALAEGVPQIVLSGRAALLSGDGATVLGWAGFEAASGLDERRLLGLGVVADAEALARDATRRLIDAFEHRPPAGRDVRPARGGYLRAPIDAGTVAVVPFHSVTDRDATVAGETVTELALAVLHRRGADVMLPGRVNETLRAHGRLLRGEVDAAVRADLRKRGADLILTGTVEAWHVVPRGGEPEPRIGFSARLLDAETGAILWWHGQDRGGWDRSRALGLGRVYASGVLAEEIMEALVGGFWPARRVAAREPAGGAAR